MSVPLELLAPAGSADIGIAAIDHGADAVYVGAPRFSARADAGVSAADIARLIEHAHLYHARVYVALNTILKDDEIPEALAAIKAIHDLGADGLIIQDPGLLETDLPPIPLIASTQMHNDTPEKIRFLEDVGFKRVILARELSLGEISEVRRKTSIELECFVHGALCVSYSGQCYMSHAIAGRSGNRGVCAQPCRLRYTLSDGNGKTIADKFLLSLKDLNLVNDIGALAGSGVTSFKIEGRYKEIDYVKNVTAAYRRTIDEFIKSNPGYRRSSSGRSERSFEPDMLKTFNRGYTRYFIPGRKDKVASFDTPKSIGEPVGTVRGCGKGFFRADGRELRNGDGLCFFTKERKLSGFRVDRVEGCKITPNTMKDLKEGVLLYRNHDVAFTRALNQISGRRVIGVEVRFVHEGDVVRVTARDEDGVVAEMCFDVPYAKPRNESTILDQLKKHVSSTGNTAFEVTRLRISDRVGFYPISLVNHMRRSVLEELRSTRLRRYGRAHSELVPNSVPYPTRQLDYHANVLNRYARRFYERHGAEVAEPAFETLSETKGREVMKMRYCLRNELDACLKNPEASFTLKEPLMISDAHHKYRLDFDCRACRMSVVFLGKKS